MFTTPFTSGTTKQDLSATRTKMRMASCCERNLPSSTALVPVNAEYVACNPDPDEVFAVAAAAAGAEKVTGGVLFATRSGTICGPADGRPEGRPPFLSTTFLNLEILRKFSCALPYSWF